MNLIQKIRYLLYFIHDNQRTGWITQKTLSEFRRTLPETIPQIRVQKIIIYCLRETFLQKR